MNLAIVAKSIGCLFVSSLPQHEMEEFKAYKIGLAIKQKCTQKVKYENFLGTLFTL